MTTSAKSIAFDGDSMWIALSDGRTPGVPLAWFPRLLHATPEQRQQCELSTQGLHWDVLDEDISIAGLLAGRGDATTATKIAAWSQWCKKAAASRCSWRNAASGIAVLLVLYQASAGGMNCVGICKLK